MPPPKRARSESYFLVEHAKKPKRAVVARCGRLTRSQVSDNSSNCEQSDGEHVVSPISLSIDASQSLVLDRSVSVVDPVVSTQHDVNTHNTHNNTLDNAVNSLLQSSHPVYVSIPHHAHKAWRVVCERLLSAYTAATDTHTKGKVLLELLQLPQNTIRLCPTRILVNQITRGAHNTQLADSSASQATQPLDGVSQQVKRAIIHTLNGDTRRANNVLRQQSRIAPRNAATMTALQQLHPLQSEPLPPLPASAPTAVAIDVKTVRRLIQTHCNNTAAGDSASGWRNKHLLPLVSSVKCMQGIGAIMVDIANGVFTGAVKRALTACTLLPLEKPNGGIRPIGIGNTFVRLAKIYAVKMSACDLKSMFPSIQLGAGQKGGCERVLHALQAFHKHAPVSSVICSTDIKNAFNTRRRRDMWDALVAQPSCEPLLRMVHWAYSDASQLCVYEGGTLYDTVSSAEGVVQGDPLAALMFALSMQPIYEQCVAVSGGKVKALAIQDDFYLLGQVDEVMKCVEQLKQTCDSAGLTLAINKCQVLPCSSNTVGVEYRDNEHIQNIRQHCTATGIKVDAELKALGSILSNYNGGVGHFLKKQVSSQQSYFDLLCHDSMPQQMAYKLLRDSANPSMNYISRVIPTYDTGDALKQWDKMVEKAFFMMHHIDIDALGSEVSAQRRQQVRLPLSMGGMGLISVYETAHAAYTASLYTAYPDIMALEIPLEDTQSVNDDTSDIATIHIQSNTVLNNQYMNERNINVLSVCQVTSVQELCQTPSAQLKIQQKLTQQLNKYRYTQLKQSASNAYQAVLLSTSQPNASRWLSNIFDCGDVMFKPSLWDAAVRHRLFIQPSDVMCTDKCECAQSDSGQSTRNVQSFVEQPAHFHVCDRMKGHLKGRHDRCKAVLYKLLTDLGATVTLEPKLSRSNVAAVQQLRADLLVVTATGKKMVDISIVCPAGQENVNIHASHRRAGRSCEVAARDKVLKYAGTLPADCTDADFIPLVFETYGAVNTAGLSWLKAVCTELSDEPDTAFNHVMNVLSATLQMGNGQVDVTGMVLHRQGQRAVQESRSETYQGHVMNLLHQYVCGMIKLS